MLHKIASQQYWLEVSVHEFSATPSDQFINETKFLFPFPIDRGQTEIKIKEDITMINLTIIMNLTEKQNKR